MIAADARQIGRLGASENPADIGDSLPIGAVTFASSLIRTLANTNSRRCVDRRKGMGCHQRDELVAPAEGEGVGADDQRGDPG
jgi:hypothetical protein